MPETPRYLPAGDQGLVVEFGDTIDPVVNRRVRDLCGAIEAAFPPGAILDLVPTYRSLLITYDPLHDLVRRPRAEGRSPSREPR